MKVSENKIDINTNEVVNGPIEPNNSDDDSIAVPKSTLLTFSIALLLHSFIDGMAVGIFKE